MKRNNKALCLLLAGAMVAANCPVSTMAAEPENSPEQLLSGEALESLDSQKATEETAETLAQEETSDATEPEVDVEEVEINADILTKGDFNYTQTADGSITITSYAGNGGTADIAGTFAGENVVAIAKWAFYYNQNGNETGTKAISRVILPTTLKSIGE